jgi:hypothetical protein
MCGGVGRSGEEHGGRGGGGADAGQGLACLFHGGVLSLCEVLFGGAEPVSHILNMDSIGESLFLILHISLFNM